MKKSKPVMIKIKAEITMSKEEYDVVMAQTAIPGWNIDKVLTALVGKSFLHLRIERLQKMIDGES
jgi:hypothetical protein